MTLSFIWLVQFINCVYLALKEDDPEGAFEGFLSIIETEDGKGEWYVCSSVQHI